MKRFASVAAVAAYLAAANIASAESLPISGAFGNESGCATEMRAEPSSEEMVVLKADQYRRYESSCEFLDIKTGGGAVQVVRALCGGEGEFWLEDYIMIHNVEAKTVSVQGNQPGEPLILKQCE